MKSHRDTDPAERHPRSAPPHPVRISRERMRSLLRLGTAGEAALTYHSLVNPRSSFPEGTDADTVSFEVLPCLLDISESMLLAGADVNLVERTLRQVGYAYGAAKMNVLVITASIIVTMTLPSGIEHTQTRRIENAVATDFAKLERLSRLCERCTADPLPPDELRTEYELIKSAPFPRPMLYIGGVLSTASFAVFFGGTILDGLVSALFSLFICFMIERLQPITPNTIVFNFIASVVTGLAIGLIAHLIPHVSPDMVMIGDIMLLIPGVAMTNATRDMISGDTISGVMRFVESLLWATALALGFMVALWIAGVSGEPVSSNGAPLVQLISSLPASLGFALFFNIRKEHILMTTLGGVFTLALYLVMASFIEGPFTPCLIASIFAAIYSEALSRHYKAPISPFFIIAVIPLIPGRGLFYTMQSAVQEEWVTCQTFGLTTLLFAVAIACGISVVWALSQTWHRWLELRYKKAVDSQKGAKAKKEATVTTTATATTTTGTAGHPRTDSTPRPSEPTTSDETPRAVADQAVGAVKTPETPEATGSASDPEIRTPETAKMEENDTQDPRSGRSEASEARRADSDPAD